MTMCFWPRARRAVSVVLVSSIVLNWIGSVRLMHAQPWISHPGPRLGKRFDASHYRFD
jgi:hypothetical protein